MVLDELEIMVVTELMALGTKGGLPDEHNCWELRGYLSHGPLFLFLRYGTLNWAEGEGRTVCICGYSKGLWDLNEDIKSLLLSLYNFGINNYFSFHQSLALTDIIPWWWARRT